MTINPLRGFREPDRESERKAIVSAAVAWHDQIMSPAGFREAGQALLEAVAAFKLAHEKKGKD